MPVIKFTASGLDRIELAQRIEDQIDAAADDHAALKAIDVTQGWPE